MHHRTRFVIFALAASAWLAAVPLAQFETPNRQFHQKTSFKLEGRHLAVSCESCHIAGQYKGTPTACVDCHWTRRQDDRFKLQLGSQCETCHNATSWSMARFDHGAATGEALSGAHRLLSCESCHKNGDFRSTTNACATCHLQDYQAAREPNHAASGFPLSCETCHKASDRTFTQARFDHQASFPLVGLHAQQSCSTCHVNSVYAGTPRDCIGCHRTDYDRTAAPSHVAAGFPTTCETCHKATDISFRGVTFNHAATFPLVGQHAQQTCVTCHKNNVYAGTPRDCISCHRTDYDRTTAPAHVAAGFPTTCETCHKATDSSFRGVTFNHAATFPLVGQHAQQTCATCHKNNVYRGTARDCVGCHRTDYDRTTAPAHVAAGFSTTCETCHKATDSSFRGVTFNHAATFPLVGQHAQQTCSTCHKNNVYAGTARDCVGCHRTDYDRTTAPAHVAAGFPTTCESCHKATDSSFRGVTFNHAATFPLVGQHAQQTCATCHKNNVYAGTARDCVGCHRTDYDRTTAPAHVAAGFSTTCESCHKATDSSFRGATFNHATVFPLLGQHAQLTCVACHTNNVYRGTARECVGCHLVQYERTTAPAHAAAGFATNCVQCHKATDPVWTHGTFNHKFPIASGRHKASCVTCHTNPSAPQVFSCLTCHEHSKSEADKEHRNINGYRYDSLACYSCHPTGRS